MPKLIIFDLDGLLIDSQPLQYKAYNQVFSKYGAPLNMQDWCEWIHNSYSTKQWIDKKRLSLDPEQIRLEKKAVYDKLIISELELKPGAHDLISRLYGKYRLCIASSSRVESIELVLDKFKLKSNFEKLFSDVEMEKGKPYPDIFLHAAHGMGATPSECLVVEDSIAGLEAAKAANMECIICPDSFCKIATSKFGDADLVVQNLNEITIEMIESL